MSDRTLVSLTILEQDFVKQAELLDGYDEFKKPTSALVTLDYFDCSDACLDFEGELIKNKVPFDKKWDGTTFITKGFSFGRLLENGEFQTKSFEDNNHKMVRLDLLVEAQREGTMNELISQWVEERFVLPWDKQIEILNQT
ncbi:hypothetical protein F7Q91_02815 [Vibrio chagasii]|uniref:Uncharacterized protein n=1 Tax=Vibrio chagasii TaxID=170679 RepID=A0A7V7NWY5_9VIBR|nr:hypothetical protein [Vibrio chagasii]KAB0482352.1 hypothetical protein F7Q91_02815 [Vibrio chagasii]